MVKKHAHDREIVSDFANPHKRFFKLVARAIRIIKMCSGEPVWTAWKQADLKQTILQRVAALRCLPQFEKQCPCGRSKSRMLQVVKLDAAQFFKAASVDRGISCVNKMLDRVEANTSKNAVAIYRLPHVKGNLYRDKKHASSHIQVVSFDDIRRALHLCKHDNRLETW